MNFTNVNRLKTKLPSNYSCDLRITLIVCMFYDWCMHGIRRNVAVFMAFTTIVNCSRWLACCGQVLISNQYVSLFYELNLYEDKVQTTIESSVRPLIPVCSYRVWRTQVVNNSTLTFIIESLMEPNNRKLYSGHNNFEFHAYSLYFMCLRYDKEIIKHLTTIKHQQIIQPFIFLITSS